MPSMTKLKTILLSHSSKYIHLSFLITLSLFSLKQPLLVLILCGYIYYMIRFQKSLIVMFIILLVIISFRLYILDIHIKPSLPMDGEIIKVEEDRLIIKNGKKYIVYIDNSQDYKPGMIISIEGTYISVDEMHIKHQMSYQEYLKTQNIYGMIDPLRIEIKSKNKSIYELPFKVNKFIDKNYEGKIKQYLKLFILGDKSALDKELYEQSQSIGISHLFAISGMHVTIILGIFNYLIGFFYIKRRTHHILLGIFLFAYNILTGFSVSIIRASSLAMLLFFSKASHFFSKTDMLSFIFIGLIIYHPLLIYYVGFQLSFLISFIILITKYNHQFSKFKQMLYISMLASLFSLPMIVSMNHTYGVLNIIINPIFIVMVSFGLLPGALVILIFPQLSIIYLHIIDAFEYSIGVVHRFNIYFDFGFSSFLYILIYWLILIMTIKSYKRSKTKIILSWLLFIVFGFIINPNQYLTKVMIFDVNQGDAIYLQSQGCNILIDTGKSDDYNGLVNYFKGENIRSLSAMILTHSHEDHIGEANDLLSELDVDEVYVSRKIGAIHHSNQKVLAKGDDLSCGQFKLLVISGDNHHKNDNNNSLVILMFIGSDTWLFTGDIETEIESEILNELPENITHLKVPHHGSNTSSTETFIKKLNPENAYISFGKNNYGIPSHEVINRLTNQGTKIYTTYEQGTIEVTYLFHMKVYQFDIERNKYYFDY